MLKLAKYSVILYYDKLEKQDLELIKNYIEKGIIVHTFLKDKLSCYIEEGQDIYHSLEEFKKLNFLYVYENSKKYSDKNVVIAYDDKILENIIFKKIIEDKECLFNSQQYEVITANKDDNIIVISGAGTGKTTTMINRLIYLRHTNEDFTFDKSVMITFTNKASIEMKERLIFILEKYYKVTKNYKYLDMMDEVAKTSISTIHSFAKELINTYGRNININKSIKIKSYKYRRSQAIIEALEKIYREDKFLYDEVKYYRIYELEAKLLEVWEKLDNFSIDINSSEYTLDFGFGTKNFSEFIKRVLKYAQSIIDEEKDDTLEVSDLMKKLSDKKLLEFIGDRYKLIMIDEFQDSDNIQIKFLSDFCKVTGAKFLVVGDEKQSIYRFRGAEYTAFDKLKEFIYPDITKIKEVSMVRNYRTNSNLLKEINEIFKDVDSKVESFSYKKKDYIYSLLNTEENTQINTFNYEDEEEKREFYINLRKNKGENESIAVLFRTNNEIKLFKEFCDKYEIPCRIHETGGFYRHEAVRDFYIMLRSLISNDLSVSYSFLETPYSEVMIDKNIILETSIKEKRKYFEELFNQIGWDKYKSSIAINSPLVIIDNIIKELNPVKNYYKRVLLKAKRTQEDYKEIAYNKTLEYKLNLEYLVYLLKETFAKKMVSLKTIEDFLKIKMATDTTIDPKKLSEDREKTFIQCLTVHKAKGLEYDNVVIDNLTNKFVSKTKFVDIILRNEEDKMLVGYKLHLGIDEDEFRNDIYSKYIRDENLEVRGEESRLLYVALTRCKKNLYLNMDNAPVATASPNSWKALVGGIVHYV